MMRTSPLHALVVGVFPVLSLYSTNADQVPTAEVIRSLSVALGGVILLWGLLAAWLRHVQRTALITSVIAVGFWAFHYAILALEIVTGPVEDATFLFSLVVWSSAFVVVAVRIVRSDSDFFVATSAMNAAAVVLVVACLATIAPALLGIASPPPDDTAPPTPAAKSKPQSRRGVPLSRKPDPLPDIFVIVLDAYGRADELAEHFDLEGAMAEQLADRGFFVAEQSTSNYNYTIGSLSSLLNLDYLHNRSPKGNSLTTAWLICHNKVAATLAHIGYRFASCSSGYFVDECEQADVYIRPAASSASSGLSELDLSNFEMALLNTTPLERWLRKSSELSPYQRHRHRILSCLDALPELAGNDSPEFVFAHIMSPHEPFVFGRRGEDVSPYDQPYQINAIFDDPNLPHQPGRVGPEYARRYRDQATYISNRVAEIVDEMLDRSETPPIVIVQGDHGPYGAFPNVRDARFPILNAYYLPGGGDTELYPEITPVNSFRIVLRHYFGADLPLLPDARYRPAEGGWAKIEDSR